MLYHLLRETGGVVEDSTRAVAIEQTPIDDAPVGIIDQPIDKSIQVITRFDGSFVQDGHVLFEKHLATVLVLVGDSEPCFLHTSDRGFVASRMSNDLDKFSTISAHYHI